MEIENIFLDKVDSTNNYAKQKKDTFDKKTNCNFS